MHCRRELLQSRKDDEKARKEHFEAIRLKRQSEREESAKYFHRYQTNKKMIQEVTPQFCFKELQQILVEQVYIFFYILSCFVYSFIIAVCLYIYIWVRETNEVPIDDHREDSYEWAKRTKFLLTVMYRSRQRHSNSSKPLRKSEKIHFYDNFRTSLIVCNNEPARPELARPWRSLTTYVSETIKDSDMKFYHNLDISL